MKKESHLKIYTKKFLYFISLFIPFGKQRRAFREYFGINYKKAKWQGPKGIIGLLRGIYTKLEQINLMQRSNLLPEEYQKCLLDRTYTEKEFSVLCNAVKYRQKIDITINSIKQKVKNKQKIKIGFIVIYDASFTLRPLFEKMLDDDIFEPTIIVAPDTSRGQENMHNQLKANYEILSKKYKHILMSYDENTEDIIDFSDDFDLFCTANPYDPMTHEFFKTEYLSSKGKPVIYSSYYYGGAMTGADSFLTDKENVYFWKIFCENDEICRFFNNFILQGMNVVKTGYAKMDKLATIPETPRERKKIIIAPHHTIRRIRDCKLSNFLTYADFFLELPKLYPNIDFVFRPHPVLMATLSSKKWWGKKKVNKYLEEIQSMSNVEYQAGGEYFDTFVNSDALIHDCGSFFAEYNYTEHPQCFILAKPEAVDEIFTDLGKPLLEQNYKAFSKQDIINFIDNVVIKGIDKKKDARIKYANKNIKIGYPNATQHILDYLKKEFQ